MKFKNRKEFFVKSLIVILALLIAPYVLPYTFELMVMLDLAGLEAALVFFILQAKPIRTVILLRLNNWKYQIGSIILLLTGIYIFQTDAFLFHTLGCLIILYCTSSFIAAFCIWLPAIYLSHQGMSTSYITNHLKMTPKSGAF